MKIEQTITLDLHDHLRCPEIRAKQGDAATRFVRITMTCGGEFFRPPQDAQAHFRCRKPDGHSCLNPAVINGDGTVTVELTDQALAVPGVAWADVCLMGPDGAVLSTMSFRIRVELAPLGENLPSESELLTLVDLLEQAKQLRDGDSAYEIAVRNGFGGTEEDWLASLVGPVGSTGPQGIPGQTGGQGPAGEPGRTPVLGVDYFTGEQQAEFVENVLERLPIDVAEDGFTDITGLRRITGLTMTRTEDGCILLEASMDGGKLDTTVVQLDQSGRPDKVIAGDVECTLTWNGFDYDTIDVWEGGSY